jgi:mannose-6-phosphate isomerase-like protein (cupin superfamily)
VCGPGAPCNCDLGKTHRLALDYRLTGLTERPLGRLETPVIDLTSGWVHEGTRPPWLGPISVGRFRVPVAGARFDRHHHDDHEIWLVHRGKAKVLTDGVAHYVQAGDVVITQAGDAHDILEVYQDLEGFFVETGYPPGGRAGHQYNLEQERLGHAVECSPLPADFPAR